jgi:hypothetical protein
MPLLLLPGIGILLGVAATRHSTFQTEIHHLMEAPEHLSVKILAHLRSRARYFRNAMIALHLSAITFAIGSLVGGLLEFTTMNGDLPVTIFTSIGIAASVFGMMELIREAMLSQEVIVDHLDQVSQHMAKAEKRVEG